MDKISPIILALLAGMLLIKGYVWIALLIVTVAICWIVDPTLFFGKETEVSEEKVAYKNENRN